MCFAAYRWHGPPYRQFRGFCKAFRYLVEGRYETDTDGQTDRQTAVREVGRIIVFLSVAVGKVDNGCYMSELMLERCDLIT